jgi:hypothetical protein
MVTEKKKKKMSFCFKHDLFSFAVMIMFAFHDKISAFSKCFPKKGKEQNHSYAHPPFFTLLEVRYMSLYPQPIRHGKGA